MVFSGVRGSLFVLLCFFFWPLCCLFYDIRILITTLVSSNSSSMLIFLARECPRGTIRCANNIECVVESQLCDGYAECSDKSDEDVDACKGKN